MVANGKTITVVHPIVVGYYFFSEVQIVLKLLYSADIGQKKLYMHSGYNILFDNVFVAFLPPTPPQGSIHHNDQGIYAQ